MDSDTIAAISTPLGMGAIGIIRVTGANAKNISSQVLVRGNSRLAEDFLKLQSKRSLFLGFRDPVSGILLDRIVYLFSSSPNSYTGEDMSEFHFHGNPILLRNALEIIYKLGARPAEPGEFTKRAFINGKMNLMEAESIGRLIHSRSRFELELAQKNYFGEVSKLSSRIRSELIGIKAECEAEIDFSSEDLTYESLDERRGRIQRIIDLANRILEKSKRTDNIIVRSKVVLFGEPNAGKSSLMNALLGRDRSIISHIPGTTRDYITEDMNISGLPIQLVDTAGIRETFDEIEKQGIDRSLRECENANVRLFIVDTSIDIDWKEFIYKNRNYLSSSIIIANKSDTKSSTWVEEEWREEFPESTILPISCKTGSGIEELFSIIEKEIAGEKNSEEYVILEDRQKYHYSKMIESLTRADELLKINAPVEIAIEEVNDSISEISSIMGIISTEEVLGRIFSSFCVGK